MVNKRAFGFGLALALGLLMAKPAPADEACQKTIRDIAKATATLNDLQKLRASIATYQASIASSGGEVADAGPASCKCDACGMTMPNKPGGNTTRAVKIGGHTFYCCAGCDMSKQVDK